MNSITYSRISILKGNIQENFDRLASLGEKTNSTFGVEIHNLTKKFDDLSKYASHQDLKHVLGKSCGTLDDNIPQPDSSLLNENKVKYWEDKIDKAKRRKK